MKVSVSVLKEYDNLDLAIKKVNESSADFLHIDVMDGKFVNNEKFPIEVVKKIKNLTTKMLDVHLMVKSQETVKQYARLMPEILTFHVEIINDNSLIKYVRSLGIKVGLAINPETNLDILIPYINDIDLVLFMSVNPGFGGQEFKKEVLDKVRKLRSSSSDKLIISIDGGINDVTIDDCKKAGCNMVVSGSYITNSNNYDEKISKLR